jgi:hypothetical protein
LKQYETKLATPLLIKGNNTKCVARGIMDLRDFEVLWVWEILTQQTKQNKQM